ncbi:hypothetical protein SELMODRAFT_451542 [Selaginella moellendorffii]|uniref:non-specific serine/threonine protein kinase n=1 Tax=Selaginella moellendorffii TaxID=88036 RepID=D8R6D3_SELML|nr:serine/threonine-protein kinase STY8 [Selaginella moellendorffii]EFJ32295.1 hypothetical protein SELMODRAFT_451542 [Selaginella moellendorffii]|eukprot:XP_002966268.1 serine/threonine-protein kinase STY8 [Selaginella moellendorffii]
MALSSELQCEAVVNQVVGRVRASGYSDGVCNELREHFARLPSRYTLNIDVERHEDVLLHMKLIQQARDEEISSRVNSVEAPSLPVVNARKVQLGGGLDTDAACNHVGSSYSWLAAMSKLPKPAFGSSTNLAGIIAGSPAKVHPSFGIGSAPPAAIPRPMFASLETEERSGGCSSCYGYELTLASSDRHGLLKFFTSALSNSSLELNIKEAHVFSTTDGMALEVFVVEGWIGDDPEELKQAVLTALSSNFTERARLREVVESLAYEDWAVDYNNLHIGARLGGGSSGRLYRGKYRGQDVAIKVIMLDEADGHSDSGTLRGAPAAELLQVFKQEVSIMRMVRHKNLVQFIGACANWPRLCIVTELMAGGSVRDVLESREGGLEVPAALKVLRDAAKGMDFLHRRGIVHRDLKSANLLIDEHDVVKVCDFGVARLKPSNVNRSGSGNWPAEMTAETGTYRWMSPEVLEHKAYDHKTDVYSFGIMIWELLTGDIPYSDLTPLQAAIGVVQRKLRPSMPASVPDKLVNLAERCWNQDPQLRPEFSEVLTIIEELQKPPANNWRKSFFRKKKP